jgi:hypothetical protein
MKQNARSGGRRQVLFLTMLILLATRAAGAPTIALSSSDWNLTVGIADVTGGAGSDFASSVRQWDTSDAQISITASAFWAVTAGVRVPAGQSWPSTVSVYVIRTGSGSATEPINGALNTPIGPVPTLTSTIPFFDGKKNAANVPIKLRIQGLAATLPAGSYQIEVVYTVN